MKIRTKEEIKETIRRVECPGYELCTIDVSDLLYLQVRVKAQNGRKWYLSQWMTDSEIVNTCLLAVLTFTEHEIREQFRYDGYLIYGPHINVNVLKEICHKLDAR